MAPPPAAAVLPDWVSAPAQKGARLVSDMGSIAIDQKASTTVGRSADLSDTIIEHASLSRRHATFVHATDARTFVIDQNSANGTFLEGESLPPHKPIPLWNGAKLRFGECPTVYTVAGVVGEEPPLPEPSAKRSKVEHGAGDPPRKSAFGDAPPGVLLPANLNPDTAREWNAANTANYNRGMPLHGPAPTKGAGRAHGDGHGHGGRMSGWCDTVQGKATDYTVVAGSAAPCQAVAFGCCIRVKVPARYCCAYIFVCVCLCVCVCVRVRAYAKPCIRPDSESDSTLACDYCTWASVQATLRSPAAFSCLVRWAASGGMPCAVKGHTGSTFV
jgi:hypothetical protein